MAVISRQVKLTSNKSQEQKLEQTPQDTGELKTRCSTQPLCSTQLAGATRSLACRYTLYTSCFRRLVTAHPEGRSGLDTLTQKEESKCANH